MSMAQLDKWKFGMKLAPTVNIATVKDNDPTPSQLNFSADGYTIKESNKGGLFFAFTAEYMFNENFSFLTGLWFTQKNYNLRNYDGYAGPNPSYPESPYYSNGGNVGLWYMNNFVYTYSGTSIYQTTYWQLPIIFKYTSKELFANFRLYGTFGPTIDIRTNEKLAKNTGDYAHYWNMAKLTGYDAWRGRNADGKKMGLFNPIDVTLFLSVGATYEIIENLDIFGGLMLNKGFVNQVNPKLKFAYPDQNQTPVNTDQTWKSFLIGFEMGAAYRFTK